MRYQPFGLTALALLALPALSAAETLYGVSFDNQLVTIDSANPSNIISGLFISGVAGANVVGIDFRPATGELYAILTDSRVGTVNLSTGAFSSVGTISPVLNGTNFGVDFNPTVDRIRVVSNTDQNLRVNPANGATIQDTNITLSGSSTSPNIAAVAYTNNFQGATSTTLYGLEAQGNNLVSFASPNNGVATTVGALGFNVSSLSGFDISGTSGIAYAAIQNSGSAGSSLYTINLGTGAATLVGAIGSGATTSEFRGLTAAPAPVPEPASLAVLGVSLAALVRRKRKNS